MATGVVSGAVALVLEANKGLTPAQVKMTLQSSATFMPEVGTGRRRRGKLERGRRDWCGAARTDSADDGDRRRDG